MDIVYGIPHIKFIPHLDTDKKKYLQLSREIIQSEIKRILNLNFPPSIAHHDNGCPFIKEHQDINISLSHTNGAISFIMHKHSKVGIDIELVSDKANKLLDRFTTQEERNIIPNKEDLFFSTLFFSAKETAYKLLNDKAKSITDFTIYDIDSTNERLYLKCLYDCDIVVNYQRLESHALTWVVKN